MKVESRHASMVNCAIPNRILCESGDRFAPQSGRSSSFDVFLKPDSPLDRRSRRRRVELRTGSHEPVNRLSLLTEDRETELRLVPLHPVG